MDLNPFVSGEILEGRRGKCLACPFLSENKTTCTKCSCSIGLKCRLKLASCPEGKWHKISIIGEARGSTK